MIEISTQEIITLIGLCSKICVVHPHKIMFDRPMEGEQFMAAQKQVRPILKRLDEEYPGLMPVPHDGVGWKDRGEL